MNDSLKDQLLAEASRIGDTLLRRAERDENGVFWKTMSLNYTNGRPHIEWLTATSIYSGVSGIALFLLELYQQTKAEKYLQTAVSAISWLEQYCQKNPADYYSFFTGRIGVAYALLRTAQVTGTSDYLPKASAVARPCLTYLNGNSVVDDLLNGRSGALLGLLHLHAATGEEWMLAAINQLIGDLLARAHYGPEGLYWDRSGQQVRGLCGFSHGAAGVGFAFLELAHYFQNDAFLWPAEQVFLYESRYFDARHQNWADWRKGVYTAAIQQKHEQAFLAGDMDFFTQPGYMNAWCHGAAGIGLSRLRAYALTGNELYAEEVAAAVARNVTAVREANAEPMLSFNLCHGLGGNADLFIEAYQTYNDETYLSSAVKIAELALAQRQKGEVYLSGYLVQGINEEDNSLFMGSAGIGYFFLRLAAPDQVPSLLLPRLTAVCTADTSAMPTINLSPAAVRKAILEKGFKRTLYFLDKQKPDKLKAILNQLAGVDNRSPFKDSFIALVQSTEASHLREEQQPLLDLLSLEQAKLKLEDAIPSCAWLHIKESIQMERAKILAALNEAALLALKLVLDPQIAIRLTAWRWPSGETAVWLNNLTAPPQSHPVILKSEVDGIAEIELAPFTYEIVNAFQTSHCVATVVHHIAAEFAIDSADSETEARVNQLILQQVREAIHAGFLVEPWPKHQPT